MVRDPSIVSPTLTGVVLGGGHNKHGTGSKCTPLRDPRGGRSSGVVPPLHHLTGRRRRRWRCDRSSYKVCKEREWTSIMFVVYRAASSGPSGSACPSRSLPLSRELGPCSFPKILIFPLAGRLFRSSYPRAADALASNVCGRLNGAPPTSTARSQCLWPKTAATAARRRPPP